MNGVSIVLMSSRRAITCSKLTAETLLEQEVKYVNVFIYLGFLL